MVPAVGRLVELTAPNTGAKVVKNTEKTTASRLEQVRASETRSNPGFGGILSRLMFEAYSTDEERGMSLTRKDFLTGSLALGAIAVLDGCGDSGNGGDGGSSGASCTDGANGPSDLQLGHSHTIAILQADIDDPQDRTYTSSTGGTHNHSVAVTAAELAELAANGTVTVMSNDMHAHTWVITCV